MAKILVVEDEADMRFVLSDNLGAEGHEVESAPTGREGIAMALSGRFGLIILDLMLPDISGIEVCKAVRMQDPSTPIIILTAKGDEIDKVVGLEVGADDYVTKPFGMREFLARVKAALRRSGPFHDEAMRECVIAGVSVDFVKREAVRDNRRTPLTRYESDLLQYLALNKGRTVTRERILQDVWGRELASGDRTVDNYIARLRSKIEREPNRPEHILTVHGSGYKLV
jgi:DNA-binding response OmpR family regulator